MGMQALAVVHGATIQHAPEPIHGRLSQIQHTGHRLFHNIPSGKLHRMSTMHCNTPHVPMTNLLHIQHPSTAALISALIIHSNNMCTELVMYTGVTNSSDCFLVWIAHVVKHSMQAVHSGAVVCRC